MTDSVGAPLPLEGIRVVEFTAAGAGPFAGMILSDLGAEVFRIEDIHQPDVNTRGPVTMAPESMKGAIGAHYPDREPGTRPYERYTMFNYLCRNRRSVTFHLGSPSMHPILMRLIDVSDVLLANRTAGVLDSMGLGYPALSERNPRLVMLEATAFGSSPGPYREYRGYGPNMEAFAGHTLLRGYPDADPSSTYTVVHGDAVGGAHAAYAICAALISRERTGKGTYLDLAQTEPLIHQLSPAVMDYVMNGRVRETLGNGDTSMAQGVYRAAGEDNWLAISIETDEQWLQLCKVMGRTDLAANSRLADVLGRRRHQNLVDEAIEAWSIGRDHYDSFHELQKAGIPAGPVLDMKEASSEPHHHARGFFEPVTYPYTGRVIDGIEGPGTHQYPGPFFDLSASPVRIRRHAPSLGQDNEYVFQEVLGLSPQEYERLIADGDIGTEYPHPVRSRKVP